MRTGPSPPWRKWTRSWSAAGTSGWGRRTRCSIWEISPPGGEEEDQSLLSQLHGKKVLVLGNHDRHRSPEKWRSLGFAEAVPWPLVWEGFFLLSHEPLYVNRNMPYANVFGHVHGNPAYRDASCRSLCVSVERTGYAPLSAQELRERIRKRETAYKSLSCSFGFAAPSRGRLFFGLT